MNAPFPKPTPTEQVAPNLPEVFELSPIETDYVDGVSTAHVMPNGLGHINLWRWQLSAEGGMDRTLAVRLVMRPTVMREVAMALLDAAMLGDDQVARLRQKMT